jgi:hypothetical protein
MSAFVVSDKTINRIISFFLDNSCDRKNEYWYDLEPLRELKYLPNIPTEWDEKNGEKLAKAMFALNCKAVKDRYGDNDTVDYKLQYGNLANNVDVFQIIKHLNCFLYQCSEGKIINTKLYKAIEKVVGNIALTVITSNCKYEAAEWD